MFPHKLFWSNTIKLPFLRRRIRIPSWAIRYHRAQHEWSVNNERRAVPLIHRVAELLVRHFGAAIAAAAMVHLNHAARAMLSHYALRDSIYNVKNLLIKTLYTRGYCVRSVKQKQELECWDCNGDGGWNQNGDGDFEPCPKCRATGVYAPYTLYKFTFKIGRPVTDAIPVYARRSADVVSRLCAASIVTYSG